MSPRACRHLAPSVRPSIDCTVETAPLKQIARWHGMTTERATSMLNALYLTSNLLVSRTGPSARAEPSRGLLSRWRR